MLAFRSPARCPAFAPRPPIPASDISLKGLSALIVKATDTVLDWQDRARQRHRLGEMDDHLLRDIGLSRADLEYEYLQAFLARLILDLD